MADYSALDKLLHHLALGSNIRAEMVHDIERSMFLKAAPKHEGRHVFVCGLARAGTTILMREIHGSGVFGSLTYADMPFVLAPNLWRKLSSRSDNPGSKSERAHGDGIEVDFHSPEALDEVYWRVFAGGAYIRPDRLISHRPDQDLIDGYRDLISLILLRTGKLRYLAKNNNNILRLGALSKAFPDAVILVPVRDPGAHVLSLLNQHRRFANSDRFTQNYMEWLGHFEFGATHRPFAWNNVMARGNPDTPDYWLAQWIAAHEAIFRTAKDHANIQIVPSDHLAANTSYWPALARRIGIDPSPLREIRAMPLHLDPEASAAAKPEAARLYQAMLDHAGQSLTSTAA
ncbi:MAG: sulfotransferase [Sphingobium sp.]